MWRIKKKTKVTLISQPNRRPVMILPGPGEAGLPRISSLREGPIRQCQEWGCYFVFQMPLASKGPLQPIYHQSYKGVMRGRGTMPLILHRAKGKDKRESQSCLCQSHPTGRRIGAQRGRWPLSEKSPLCELSLASDGAPPVLTIPQYAPFHFCTTPISQEFFLINLKIYFPMANMPQSWFCPRSPPRTSMAGLQIIRRSVSNILSQVFF